MCDGCHCKSSKVVWQLCKARETLSLDLRLNPTNCKMFRIVQDCPTFNTKTTKRQESELPIVLGNIEHQTCCDCPLLQHPRAHVIDEPLPIPLFGGLTPLTQVHKPDSVQHHITGLYSIDLVIQVYTNKRMLVRFSSLITRFSTEILLFQFSPCQLGKDEGYGRDRWSWTDRCCSRMGEQMDETVITRIIRELWQIQ